MTWVAELILIMLIEAIMMMALAICLYYGISRLVDWVLGDWP